jgi:hypothetical protein
MGQYPFRFPFAPARPALACIMPSHWPPPCPCCATAHIPLSCIRTPSSSCYWDSFLTNNTSGISYHVRRFIRHAFDKFFHCVRFYFHLHMIVVNRIYSIYYMSFVYRSETSLYYMKLTLVTRTRVTCRRGQRIPPRKGNRSKSRALPRRFGGAPP